MSDHQLNYLGAMPKALTDGTRSKPWWRRVPWAFLAVVVLPTLVTAIYFLLIASPRYVSESQFIVRAANQSQPSSLGVALQGVGISSAQSDTFAVHEYIKSRDAVQDLKTRFDLPGLFSAQGADVFSRYPHFGDKTTDEGLFRGLKRFVTVGYDSTTGISVLRVQAFRGQDAHAVNEVLLEAGEKLINRLNERSALDAVSAAERARTEAQSRLASAQQQMTAFRNRERFLDPTATATESSELVGGLLATIAQLNAERAQLAAEAPSSPQLPFLDNRIAAYERQVAAERAKIAGNSASLAPKLSVYENLVLQQELADKEVTATTAAVTTAQQEARRQKLYLDRVVPPNTPDQAIEPRRLRSVITVFLVSLLIFGVGWMIYSGVREHRLD